MMGFRPSAAGFYAVGGRFYLVGGRFSEEAKNSKMTMSDDKSSDHGNPPPTAEIFRRSINTAFPESSDKYTFYEPKII